MPKRSIGRGLWRSATIGFAFALAGCRPAEPHYPFPYPTLSVSPGVLEFGEVAGKLASARLPVRVQNAGLGVLNVSGHLEGSPVFRLPDGPVDLWLASGQQVDVDVDFAPDTFQIFSGELVLESSGGDWLVPIGGTGVFTPIPDIEIRPGRTIEADAQLGESEPVVFQVWNLGDYDLVIGQTALDGSDRFEVLTDVSGIALSPGDFATMVVNYTPQDVAGDHTIVHVSSNDPDEPDVLVLLLANGG